MQNNQKGVCSGNLVHSVTSKNLGINPSIIDSYEFGLSFSDSLSVCTGVCLRVYMCVCLRSLRSVFQTHFHRALITRRSRSIGDGVVTLKSHS